MPPSSIWTYYCRGTAEASPKETSAVWEQAACSSKKPRHWNGAIREKLLCLRSNIKRSLAFHGQFIFPRRLPLSCPIYKLQVQGVKKRVLSYPPGSALQKPTRDPTYLTAAPSHRTRLPALQQGNPALPFPTPQPPYGIILSHRIATSSSTHAQRTNGRGIPDCYTQSICWFLASWILGFTGQAGRQKPLALRPTLL